MQKKIDTHILNFVSNMNGGGRMKRKWQIVALALIMLLVLPTMTVYGQEVDAEIEELQNQFREKLNSLEQEGFGDRLYEDKDFELQNPSSNKSARELFNEKFGDMYDSKKLEHKTELPDQKVFSDYISNFKDQSNAILKQKQSSGKSSIISHKGSFNPMGASIDTNAIKKSIGVGKVQGPGNWLTSVGDWTTRIQVEPRTIADIEALARERSKMVQDRLNASAADSRTMQNNPIADTGAFIDNAVDTIFSLFGGKDNTKKQEKKYKENERKWTLEYGLSENSPGYISYQAETFDTIGRNSISKDPEKRGAFEKFYISLTGTLMNLVNGRTHAGDPNINHKDVLAGELAKYQNTLADPNASSYDKATAQYYATNIINDLEEMGYNYKEAPRYKKEIKPESKDIDPRNVNLNLSKEEMDKAMQEAIKRALDNSKNNKKR